MECYNVTMKLNKTVIKEVVLACLAFIIPFLMLIIIFSINKISLSSENNYTVMMIDMQSQYISYIRYFRNALLGDNSLIYNSAKTFGGDFLSIYTYYLASPFNLFTVFFKEDALPLFFIWSSLFKMCFASLNMYFLLRFNDKFNYQKIIFAIGYGLMSYSFIYLSNFMWLDGVMILPLVILGLQFVRRGKHYWLYPLAIAYALMTSWYIGFMICIFTFLYFLCLFIEDFKLHSVDKYKFLLRFAIFSLAGGLLAAMFWMTAFLHLGGTKGQVSLPKLQYYPFTSMVAGFFENNYAESALIKQYNSYATMFVGVVPLVFFLIFFFCKEYTIREKLSVGTLFLFYILCSVVSTPYALLHGGSEPTWFPTRYSFLLSFLVCYLGSKGADNAHKVNPLCYVAPAGIGIISLLIVASTQKTVTSGVSQISTPSIIMYFVTILVGVIISIVNQVPAEKLEKYRLTKVLPYAVSLLAVVQIISSYRGGNKVISQNVKENQYQKYSVYLQDDEYTSSFNKIKKYEEEHDNEVFYRMESTFNRPGNYNQIDNNPLFYSYNGLSHFSSSEKKEVKKYLNKLGFQNNSFFSKYDGGSTYIMNSALGVKYLLDQETAKNRFYPYFLDYNTFEKLNIEDDNNVNYYLNNNCINLGFIADKSEEEIVETRQYNDRTLNLNHFEYQNSIFRTFVKSIDKDVFYPMDITGVYTSLNWYVDENQFYVFKNVKKGDYASFKFETPIEGYGYPLYFGEEIERRDIYYYIDGKRQEVNSYWHGGVHSFEESESHYHSLDIYFNKDVSHLYIKPEFYYEDLSITNEYLSTLNEGEFQVTKGVSSLASKGYEGTINVTDNNKELIFTLPYEKEIRVTVDGKKVKTLKRWNIFTAIDLSNLSLGEHKVKIEYIDAAFSLALPISITSLLGIAPLVIFYDKLEKMLFKRKKEEQ